MKTLRKVRHHVTLLPEVVVRPENCSVLIFSVVRDGVYSAWTKKRETPPFRQPVFFRQKKNCHYASKLCPLM